MRDLTRGPLTGHVLAMSAPIAVGMFVQTMHYLVDLYFVSRLGDVALAGVSAAGTVFFIVLALTQVLGVATVALISHAVGRNEQAEANRISRMFRDQGLKRGDHVAFCVENRAGFLAFAWGAHYAGCYYTAISTRLTPEEAGYIINDCSARVVLCSPSTRDVIARVKGDWVFGFQMKHRLRVLPQSADRYPRQSSSQLRFILNTRRQIQLLITRAILNVRFILT